MFEELREVLLSDERIAYALVFGSAARGKLHAHSDIDVAIGLRDGASLDAREALALVSRLEASARRTVDVVLLDEAGPAIAYRAFRDGRILIDRDRRALVERKARAIVEYLDFKPIEDRCADGVLRAARRGR